MLKIILLSFLYATAFAFPGDPWCFEREISLNKKQLRCLRSLDEVKDLQKGMAVVLRRRATCPKCPKTISPGEDEYAPLFRSPFLVLASKLNRDFRGVELDIIFKNGFDEVLKVQMEPKDDGSGYVPSLAWTGDSDKKILRLLKKLRGKEFDDMWLNKLSFDAS